MSARKMPGAYKMTSQETIRLEEYTGLIQNKIVAVWHGPDAASPWLPTEFLLAQYITRILVTGRTSPLSSALSADPSWTQIWRSPGGKEWSCLLGVLPHMPGPALIVIGPDIAITPKLMQQIRATGSVTVVVLRVAGGPGWNGDPADHVFFPVLDGGRISAPMMAAVNEWTARAIPRQLDLKPLLPQLAAQGYALTVAGGSWFWYKPAESTGFAALSVAQIARQLQILGTLLEKSGL